MRTLEENMMNFLIKVIRKIFRIIPIKLQVKILGTLKNLKKKNTNFIEERDILIIFSKTTLRNKREKKHKIKFSVFYFKSDLVQDGFLRTLKKSPELILLTFFI